MDTVCALLKSHKSIRKFSSKTVTEDQVQTILEAGNAAATSSNVQARSVIRLSQGSQREQIAEWAGNQHYIAQAPEFWVFCADLHHAHLACSKQKKVMHAGPMTESFIIATVDVAIMAQNCVVAAESMGLGICYIGAVRNNPEAISTLLGIPEYVYPVFGLCIGHPAQEVELKPRLPLHAVVKREVWTATDMKKIDDYDAELQQYYKTRTRGKKKSSWSEEVSDKMAQKIRPFMRTFLQKKGFKME